MTWLVICASSDTFYINKIYTMRQKDEECFTWMTAKIEKKIDINTKIEVSAHTECCLPDVDILSPNRQILHSLMYFYDNKRRPKVCENGVSLIFYKTYTFFRMKTVDSLSDIKNWCCGERLTISVNQS